ncbi:hypothetical protein [Sphingomonas echinoides]|uniref:hypothetical protein n=1 Tax=Sphingomonas echinoides TaxID=59803 RepID=UPI002412FDB3|nr:hypothetical protein [Sphingomonas echinoides]
MKSIVLAAVVLASAAPLAAQSAPSAAPVAAAATPVAKFTLDTPIETIAADPAAKKVLDADLNNITAHPMYDQFKSMSLSQVQPLSGGALTDEALVKVKADLAVLK